MPDIQMIMDASTAVQGSGSAASLGGEGNGEVFGKALSQAKTTIDEKPNSPKNPRPDGAKGRRDAPDSAPSERAAEAYGGQRGKARQQEDGMPNLPTRQPSEKPAINGLNNAERPAAKPELGQALNGPGLKSRSEAWAEVGLELPDSLSEGTPLQFWRGEPSVTDNAAQEEQQDPELAVMIQQIVNNIIGDAMPAFVPPEIVHYEEAIQSDLEAVAQLGDEPANPVNEKSGGQNDIWHVLEDDGKGSVEVINSKDGGANAIAAHRAEHAEKIAIRPAAESANGVDGTDGVRADNKVAAQPSFYSAEDLQAMTRRPKKKRDTPHEITDEGDRGGKDASNAKIEKQGEPSAAAEMVDAKARAEGKVRARVQANSHHRTPQVGDKSLADAELALGLRHEMAIGPAEEEKAAPSTHFRNGQAPREIESALPKQEKGQEKTVGAKEAKETRPQRAEGEDAAQAKAAQSRHVKANFRTQIKESEEEQDNNATAEKAHSEGRQAGRRRGADSAKEAAIDAAARRSAREGEAPGQETKGTRGSREPGAPTARGRRHAQSAPNGQDSISAQAREATRPAPPPMRMDAAPQSKADAAKAGAKADQGTQGAQNAAQTKEAGQSSQSSQASQNTQNGQNNSGGHGSQSNQSNGNSLGGQNSQGQNSYASHKGSGDGSGETFGARQEAAQAKQSGGFASHTAGADAKSATSGGHITGGPAHGQGQAQGQALPGSPILPGSPEHHQAHAHTNGKPQLPQLPPQAPMAQMDGSVKWMLRNEQQAAEIQLYPEHLGKVTIRLRVEGNEVHARVWASEASTLPVLKEHRAYLESSLKEQGLQLSSFDLQHGKGGQQAPDEHRGGEGQNRPQGQHFHFGAQMIESWNGSEFRQELPTQATTQVAAQVQNGGRVELYA